MGNNSSQEEQPRPETPSLDPGDEEHFDLDKIPNEQIALTTTSPPMPPPDDVKPLPAVKAQSNTKRRRKTRRKSSTSDSDSAANVAVPEKSQNLETEIPENPLLRELEPETFHIYATSDEESDDTLKKKKKKKAHKTTDVNRRSAAQVARGANGSTTNRSSPDQQEEFTTPSDSPNSSSREASRQKSTLSKRRTNLEQHSDTNEDEPSQFEAPTAGGFTAINGKSSAKTDIAVNGDGRWPCPFFDLHNCNKTFASKKVAIKHARGHIANHVCSVCNKKLSRPDTLNRHLARHTALEIAAAESGKSNDASVAKDLLVTNDTKDQDQEPDTGAGSSSKPTSPLQVSQSESIEQDEPVAAKAERTNGSPSRSTSEACPAPGSLTNQLLNIVVKETPADARGQKRTREESRRSHSDGNASPQARKRRKQDTRPTPKIEFSTDSRTRDNAERQVTDKIVPHLQPRRQSSIDGWAQAYQHGSNLRHPTLNPKSPPRRQHQQVDVVIPRTSQAGPSSGVSKSGRSPHSITHLNSDHLTNENQISVPRTSNGEIPTTVYTSSNGKDRAESGVEYSSPSRNGLSGRAKGTQSRLATSVAKRTFSRPSYDHKEDDLTSDDIGDVDGVSECEVSDTELKLWNTMNEKFECGTCHTKFASERSLERHLNTPDVHAKFQKCQVCSQQFRSLTALRNHQTESGHANRKGSDIQGRVTGVFDDFEVQKLNRWKARFCEEHDITSTQFNDMMTDTLRRGQSWNWPFISSSDFLKRYYSVLPARDKRSMLRYRERNFQNRDGSLNWTDDDDKELIRLQKELGSKWSKIGNIMMRTADAVAQRWRHKLQYSKADTGKWSRDETIKFNQALNEIRSRSGVATDVKGWHILWAQVSNKVGTRSAQQCSNHYRALHGTKKEGKWVLVPGLEKTLGASRILTPSRMQSRLEGKASAPRRMEATSPQYVVDDDDTDDDEEDPIASNTSSPTVDARFGYQEEQLTGKLETLPKQGRQLPTNKTPAKTLAPSQLFAQTQANTSALKSLPLPKEGHESASPAETELQERPSPNISIQRRPLSRSPLQEISLPRNQRADAQASENSGNMESRSKSDDEDVELEQSQSGSSDSEDENEDTSEEESSGGAGSNDRHDTIQDEAEAGIMGGSSSDEDDAGPDGEDGDATSDDESNSDQQDTTDAKARNGFIDSINESVQRLKSSQVRKLNGRFNGFGRKTGDSESESE